MCGVPAEYVNMSANPTKCRELISQPEIPPGAETERTKTILNFDKYRVIRANEAGWIGGARSYNPGRLCKGPHLVRPSVQKYEDRNARTISRK